MAESAVTGEHHPGRWTDVGTPQRLAQLDLELPKHDLNGYPSRTRKPVLRRERLQAIPPGRILLPVAAHRIGLRTTQDLFASPLNY